MSLEVHNVALSVVHTTGDTPNRDRLLQALLDMILAEPDGQSTLMETLWDRQEIDIPEMVTFFFSCLPPLSDHGGLGQADVLAKLKGNLEFVDGQVEEPSVSIPALSTLKSLRERYYEMFQREWPGSNQALVRIWQQARALHGKHFARVPTQDVWDSAVKLMHEVNTKV